MAPPNDNLQFQRSARHLDAIQSKGVWEKQVMVLTSTERDEIINETNTAVKCRCTKPEVVKRISELMGLSGLTIYDYLAKGSRLDIRHNPFSLLLDLLISGLRVKGSNLHS